MKDSYLEFLSKFKITQEDLFKWGLENTIYIERDDAFKDEWESLKQKISANDKKVFIRGFGRNAEGTKLFFDFYKEVYGNDKVEKDATNNAQPTKIIERMTKFKKNSNIRNYQVSHIFGRTKNIYAFTAPWNIVFMPKILDPFTGHEAKGDMPIEFQSMFQKKSHELFKPYIEEFNQIIRDKKEAIGRYFLKLEKEDMHDPKIIKKFKDAVGNEFSEIQ